MYYRKKAHKSLSKIFTGIIIPVYYTALSVFDNLLYIKKSFNRKKNENIIIA